MRSSRWKSTQAKARVRTIMAITKPASAAMGAARIPKGGADFQIVERELRLAPAEAPRTPGWFGAWQQAVEELRPRTGGL